MCLPIFIDFGVPFWTMAALGATPWRPFGGQGRYFGSKKRFRKSNLKTNEKRDWTTVRSAAEALPPIDLLHRSFYIDQGYLVTAYRTQGAAPDLQADASAADPFFSLWRFIDVGNSYLKFH